MTSFSVEILLQEQGAWDFPGGPVVRIPSCHCCDLGSIPAWGTEILQAAWATKKEKGKSRGRNGPAWSREGPPSVSSLLHRPIILASEEQCLKSTGVYACGIFFCSDIRGWRLKTERRKEWEEFVIRSANNGHWRWPLLLFHCQYGCSQCGVADISCRSWFQFFGGKYPEVGLPDHVEIPFEICGVSSIATVPFTFPPTVHKCSGFSTSSPTF